jgi:hypothetical protein
MEPMNMETTIRLLEGAAAAITVVVGLVTMAHLLGWLEPETINEEGHSGENTFSPEQANASSTPLDVRHPEAQDCSDCKDEEGRDDENDHECQ